MVQLAEALDDAEAIAAALAALGTGYNALGAPRVGIILLERSASTAREHDLPLPLARALNNLAAFSNCRDLTAAIRAAHQARDVARRAGLQYWVDAAGVNAAIGLWCAGRLTEAAELVADGVLTDLGFGVAWWTIEVWLAEARGEPIPAPRDDAATRLDCRLAWLGAALARAVDVAVTARRPASPSSSSNAFAVPGLDETSSWCAPPVLAARGAAVSTSPNGFSTR